MTYRLLTGDVLDVAAAIEPGTVHAVITSPPYAEQRVDQYGGIPEADYPAWTVAWLDAIAPALTPDANVIINVRPHLADGQISDYMLHTRLAVRAAGWVECEELIWAKDASPPLGSNQRPRRAWESLHWFARTPRPFVDLYTNGARAQKFRAGGSHGVGDYIGGLPTTAKERARITDVVIVGTGVIDQRDWLDHPAKYPTDLAAWLVNFAAPGGGLVLDPFNGSGTTGEAALRSGRDYVGIDRDPGYIAMTERRLAIVDAQGSLL